MPIWKFHYKNSSTVPRHCLTAFWFATPTIDYLAPNSPICRSRTQWASAEPIVTKLFERSEFFGTLCCKRLKWGHPKGKTTAGPFFATFLMAQKGRRGLGAQPQFTLANNRYYQPHNLDQIPHTKFTTTTLLTAYLHTTITWFINQTNTGLTVAE